MNKILVFGITNNPGGVESVIMNYYRYIDKSKVQFDFLCNTKIVAYEDEIKQLGGNIYKITARSQNRKQFYKDLKSFFEKHAKEYSTIWVNVCSLANIDYLKYAKKYGIKYRIIHSHNSQNMDSKIRLILHKLNKIIIKKYATDFWSCGDEATKWFYNSKIIKNENVLIVNNAINLQKFEYSETVREEYRENLKCGKNLVLGNVGRFHFQKNQDFLIDIFAEVVKKDKNSILLLVGQGEDEKRIKNKVSKLGLINNVKFLGIRNDVERIMQCMDVFVFPSLFEGFGIVLLEAQASGMPIVASSDVIPQNVKMSDNFHFISLNESAKAWANVIMKLSKIDNRKTLSHKNIINITNCGYNIVKEAKKLEKLFERE